MTSPVRMFIARSRTTRFLLEPENKATLLGGLVQALIGTTVWVMDFYAGCPPVGTLNYPAVCFPPWLRDIAILGGLAGGIVAGYFADLTGTAYGLFLGVTSALAGVFLGALSVGMIAGLDRGLAAERQAASYGIDATGLWVVIAVSFFIRDIPREFRIGILTSPLGGLLGAYLRNMRRGEETGPIQTEAALEQKQSGP